MENVDNPNASTLPDNFDISYGLNVFVDELGDSIEKARKDKDYSVVVALTVVLTRITKIRDDVYAGAGVSRTAKVINTNRAHVTDKLATLNQAAEKFWARADPKSPDTIETNSTVSGWLKQRGFSDTLAEKGATIIRPEWAGKGRKPEQ